MLTTILSLVISLSAFAANTQNLGPGYACMGGTPTKSIKLYLVEILADRTGKGGIGQLIADDISRRPTIELYNEQGTWQYGVAGITYSSDNMSVTLVNGGFVGVGRIDGERFEGRCEYKDEIYRIKI